MSKFEELFPNYKKFYKFIVQRYFNNYNQKKNILFGLDNVYQELITHSSEYEQLTNDLVQIYFKEDLNIFLKNILNQELDKDYFSNSKLLFDLLNKYVRLDNGDFSELWVAILLNGKIARQNKNPVTDVILNDGVRISIKNVNGTYNSLDFGTLPSIISSEYYRMLRLIEILSGRDLNATMTRKSINNILKYLNHPDLLILLNKIFQLDRNSKNVNIIKSFIDNLKEILDIKGSNDLNRKYDNTLVLNFINKINKLIETKIYKVNYWMCIDNNRGTFVISDSDTIFNKLKCSNYRLSEYVMSLGGGNKLRVSKYIFGFKKIERNKKEKDKIKEVQ